MNTDISVQVDGTTRRLTVDTRTTLLDALRERLGVMSAKKGCDHGQCGACTVLSGGQRVLSCLTLAVTQDGARVVTAEGLAAEASGAGAARVEASRVEASRVEAPGTEAPGTEAAGTEAAGVEVSHAEAAPAGGRHADADGGLHPVQQAFIDCDAFQCGYCTPGQVVSAAGMLDEFARGWPSAVTGGTRAPRLDRAEVAERMSGNLCRCGAYATIVPAVQQAAAASTARRAAGTRVAG